MIPYNKKLVSNARTLRKCTSRKKIFFAFAEKRTPEKIEDWLKTLSHKVLRLDGTKPIQENVEHIKSLLLWEKGDRASGG